MTPQMPSVDPETPSGGGGGQDLSEIMQVKVVAGVNNLPDGTEITGLVPTWELESGLEGGEKATWDAATGHPKAGADGRYRLSWQIYLEPDSTAASVAIRTGVVLYRNEASELYVIARSIASGFINASSTEIGITVSGSKIVDLSEDDTIRIHAAVSNSSGGIDVDLGSTATWVQLEYLGPIPS